MFTNEQALFICVPVSSSMSLVIYFLDILMVQQCVDATAVLMVQHLIDGSSLC